MEMSGFVNDTERQAALHCQAKLRLARAALRDAHTAAITAGFGGMMLTQLDELVDAVEQFRTTYDIA